LLSEFHEFDGVRYPRVIEKECVGCNLCYLICPSPGAITMERVDAGGPTQSWRERTAAK
jgi:dihydropyrimidine dehydrogenase (NAD+) subunit PreA